MKSLCCAVVIATSAVLGLSGCVETGGGYYPGAYGSSYDRHDYYDSDRHHHYDRDDRHDHDRDHEREMREERERKREREERERDERERRERQHHEEERHEGSKFTQPREEHCPSGFSPSERKCSTEERRRGCKDMRLPGGLGCVKR